jgi:hypothetical protein
MPLPMPNAPITDLVLYYQSSPAAGLAVGIVQVLSAIALFVFVGSVASLVRQLPSDDGRLLAVTRVGGILSAAFLLVCGLLGLLLVAVSGGGNLLLLGTLRTLNFLSGGTLHIASLGLFVGAASLAAHNARALPRRITWWGIVQSVIAILSLASLVVFPAALFILLGRMLGFVWCIAVGITLAIGKRRVSIGGEHLVHSK